MINYIICFIVESGLLFLVLSFAPSFGLLFLFSLFMSMLLLRFNINSKVKASLIYKFRISVNNELDKV